MFKSLLNKIKTKRSPIDPSDWIAESPQPKPFAEVQTFVYNKIFPPGVAPPASSEIEEQSRQFQARHMAFDLKYRCGASGRCTSGKYRCRFPECFAMRPIPKGADVFTERSAYEVDDVPNPEIQLVVKKAKEEKLDECIIELQQLVERRLADSGDEFGKAGHTLTEEAVGMMQWRASLLVNIREDEKAVNSLLNFMRKLQPAMQAHVACPAAQWAFWHDLEVLFYVRHKEEFPDFVPFRSDITADEMLLPRVIAEIRGLNRELLDHVAHHIFGKHISAIVQRGETSQKYQEEFEEPMKSEAIADELRYLRNTLTNPNVAGDAVWERYIGLATMPATRPKFNSDKKNEEEKVVPAIELNSASAAVVDAVGRSILCHHLAGVCKEFNDKKDLERVSHRLKELLLVAQVGEKKLVERKKELAAEYEKQQLEAEKKGGEDGATPQGGGEQK